MKPGGSVRHSQGLSNNPYPEPTLLLVLVPIYLGVIVILSFHQRMGLTKGLFPIGLSVKIF